MNHLLSLFRWCLIYAGDCPDCLRPLDFRLTCKSCLFDADGEPACDDACLLDHATVKCGMASQEDCVPTEFEQAWDKLMDDLGGES